jgi:hypothetical protein
MNKIIKVMFLSIVITVVLAMLTYVGSFLTSLHWGIAALFMIVGVSVLVYVIYRETK